MFHDEVQIVRFAAVVERRLTVRFARTAPEVPGHHVPAPAVEGLGHAQHVAFPAVSFESVGQDGDAA